MVCFLKNSLLIHVLLFSFSLSVNSQEASKFRIDPSRGYGGRISEYFDSVEYIPLETNSESLFGDIYRIIVTDSGFVITDLDTRGVYFFSKEGRFLSKVKNNPSPVHDRVKNLITFLKYSNDGTKLSISYYSLSGVKLNDTVCYMNEGLKSRIQPIPLLGNYYASCNNCSVKSLDKESPESCAYLSIYNGAQLVNRLLPMDISTRAVLSRIWGFLSPPSVVEDGAFYISTPFEYKIYKVNKTSAVKSFEVVFPASRVLPQAVLKSTDILYIDSIGRAIQNNPKLIADIENIFFIGTKLFFKLRPVVRKLSYNNSINDYQYNFLYDTLTHKLVTLDRITPDSLSYYLPTMSENSKASGLISFDHHLYSYMSSLQLFAAYDAVKSKNPMYSPVLEKYFRTQNRKSNPVIVRMKLKE